jgi:hypothetical protein
MITEPAMIDAVANNFVSVTSTERLPTPCSLARRRERNEGRSKERSETAREYQRMKGIRYR